MKHGSRNTVESLRAIYNSYSGTKKDLKMWFKSLATEVRGSARLGRLSRKLTVEPKTTPMPCSLLIAPISAVVTSADLELVWKTKCEKAPRPG